MFFFLSQKLRRLEKKNMTKASLEYQSQDKLDQDYHDPELVVKISNG